MPREFPFQARRRQVDGAWPFRGAAGRGVTSQGPRVFASLKAPVGRRLCPQRVHSRPCQGTLGCPRDCFCFGPVCTLSGTVSLCSSAFCSSLQSHLPSAVTFLLSKPFVLSTPSCLQSCGLCSNWETEVKDLSGSHSRWESGHFYLHQEGFGNELRVVITPSTG